MKKTRCLIFFLVIVIIMIISNACKKAEHTLVWSELATPTTAELRDVHFIHPDTGYAVGGTKWYHGEALETNDGGQTWTSDTLTDNILNCINSIDPQHQFMAGFNGYYLSRSSSSAGWFFSGLPNNIEIHAVDFFDEFNGIAVGGGSFDIGIIYRFNLLNGQIDVITEDLDHEIQDVAFLNANEAIAVGYGIVLKTYDAGRTWEPKPIDGEFFLTVNFPTPSIGYAAGYTGTIVKTTDGGETWEKLRNGNKLFTKREIIRDIYFVDQDKGYLVGDEGVFWKTEDGGQNWQFIEIDDAKLNAIEVQNGVGYICADQGRIYKFVD